VERLPRFARYAGVSIVATVLAQAALALAYGVLSWPVVPAVAFSLGVSAGPAYLLSRRYVWPDGGQARAVSGQAAAFVAVAGIGAAVSVVLVWAAVKIATTSTTDHTKLAIVANSASVAATGLVWVARYVVLDRFLFTRRPLDRPTESSAPA
jgi:putative flippase GtrA